MTNTLTFLITALVVYTNSLTINSQMNSCRVQDASDTQDWKRLLSANYSPEEYPKNGTGQPHDVYLSLDILDIPEVNAAQMSFSVQMFVIQQWTDHQLVTKSIPKDGSRFIPDYAVHCFWRPSMIFENSQEGRLMDVAIPNSLMIVYDNKTVVHASRFNIQFRCKMNLRRYPMDTQNCQMVFRLLDETATMVQLKWIDNLLSPYKDSNRKAINLSPLMAPLNFRVTDPVATEKTTDWLGNPFTNLYANFKFVRKLTPSIITFYAPSAITVLMACVGFWIDVQAVPGRVTLGLTASLSIMTQSLETRKLLPQLNYVTALDIYLFVCLILVSLSFIEYGFAYSFMKEESQLMADVERANVLKKNNSSKQMFERLVRKSSLPANDPTFSSYNFSTYKSWLDTLSKYLFPALFLAFNASYWAYYYFTESEPGLDDAQSLEL